MFETSRRRHPLHTFKFWFVVIGAVAVTIAWKCDLLPVRIGPTDTGRLAEESFTDVDQVAEVTRKGPDDSALPFHDDDQTLELPTIAPEQTVEPSVQPLESIASKEVTRSGGLTQVESENEVLQGTLFDQSAMHRSPAERPLRKTVARESAPGAIFDDEWPTQFSSETAGTGDSNIMQTNATRTSFESEASRDLRSYDSPFQTAALPQPAAAAPAIDFQEIDQLIAAGTPEDEIEAHRLLSGLYWQKPEARGTLRERIDMLAQRIYFLGSRHYMDAYQVQPGDMLQKIARNYDISWQYLAKLNRVDPRKVRSGQRLKVIKGPFSAIVDLSDYELTIHSHGYYVTRFPVGIGKDGSSPIGSFTVQEKLVDPTYYGPDKVVAHDDPTNPLGERWIDLGNSYGIHGTIDPASIGKSESRGCIRLNNDDVAAVFDLLTLGSEVTIRP